ncbi:mitochondrial protein Pet127-domain-containing protein [Dactylonectria macrodidyma]|uniref:Mitochondrial protein Pet127-domain-containing protein n=1 Tax=Dactylonectria macrodidyma TaxID=307937 RepID=A0A9P9JK70_9HYPO|nr:mitochondrial protein Pet127-domain-containing protein [Dactylonectria macrodidyma]
MLRLRRGAGQSVRYARLLPIRSSGLRLARCRAFATDHTSEDAQASKASVDGRLEYPPTSAKQSRQLLSDLKSDLRRQVVNETNGLHDSETPGHIPTVNQKPTDTIIQDEQPEWNPILDVASEGADSFDDALNVVRRVYGVEEANKSLPIEKRRKRKKKSNASTEDTDTAPVVEDSNQPTGVWTSLREKLRQEASDSKQTTADDPTPISRKPVARKPVARKPVARKPVARKSTTRKPAASKLVAPTHAALASVASADPTTTEQAKSKTREKKEGLVVNTISPRTLRLTPVEEDQTLDVPTLAHDLDRVLFNPGVYDLQDRRSRVYNFDPHLASIMPAKEFDFNALKEYITSSKDVKLRTLCAKHEKKYCGSTSSMTAILSHFHFLLSAWRKPIFSTMSRTFDIEYETFTKLTRAPAVAFANYKDGVYAIDADKQFDTANILSMLGKSMEKLLTLPKEEFEKYRRDRSHQLSEEERNAEEAFHYTTLGDFLMRSQLDAYDPRLPGTGMFDLKTRAVVSIRMDVEGYEKGVGYEIKDRFGQWQSYEREYYDMIRSALLKYSLQVRMGRMDGIFVAFHNTQRIFGFQYISLTEMDQILHGTPNFDLGDHEFKASLVLLNDLLDRAAARFPGRSLRLHVETRETKPPLTYFFAEPVDDEDIALIQSSGRKRVEKFETEILGLARKESEAESAQLNSEATEFEQDQTNQTPRNEDIQDPQGQNAWDELMLKVDETVENDALGLQTVRDAIHEALEQSGLLGDKSDAEKESYLNALVEAITAELSEGKDAHKDAIEEPPSSDEKQEQGVQEADGAPNEGPMPSVHGELSYGGEINHQMDEGTSSLAETAEHVIHDSESSEVTAGTILNKAGDAEPGTGESADESSLSNNDIVSDSSLKDLIMKVAQGVNHKSPNLGTFEQVLSQLVLGPNQPGRQDDDDDDDMLGSEKSQDEGGTGQPQQPDPEMDSEATTTSTGDRKKREVLGMYVTVQNKLNGKIVDRIDNETVRYDRTSKWDVEYTITELPDERAGRIRRQLKRRRAAIFNIDPDKKSEEWHHLWGGRLSKTVKQSKALREVLDKIDQGKGVRVAWEKTLDKEPVQPKAKSES